MISVVIPAFNEEKLLPQCLEALATQTTKQHFEVIVVDNNSTDRTAEIARSYAKRLNLRLLLEKKRGRGAARKRGFAEAKGDIVFSTDADARVPPDWIERLLPYFKDRKVVGVSGPCLVNDLVWWKNIVVNVTQPTMMHVYRLFMGHYWLAGFNFAIRKRVYLDSGGFDARLHGLEDTELAMRVSQLGKIRCVPVKVTFSGRRFSGNFWLGIFE
jgi:glycosyltransferase involved in cell wall biosynthesis